MNYNSKILFLTLTLLIFFFMVLNPQETVNAAAQGINLWALVVLPALLPFFIVAELLVNLGLVNFLGVILEKIMRPLFRLPGSSSLVVVMGFTSGFPIGAVLTRKLFEEKLLNRNEAERLLCFTNNCSPLFIMGAIGIGIFSNPLAGYILAFSHYLSNIMVGILLRFQAADKKSYPNYSTNLFKKALSELKKSQEKNPLTIGGILGNAIKNSINNVIAIAGFIVVFSVLSHMLCVWGIMPLIVNLIRLVFSPFNINYSLAHGISTGIFEITLGSKAIAASSASLPSQLIWVSVIMAFSGLSIIAQIMSIMSGIPIRWHFYLGNRILQMILSAFLTYWFCKLFKNNIIPVFSIYSWPLSKLLYANNMWHFSIVFLLSGLLFIFLLSIIVLIREK